MKKKLSSAIRFLLLFMLVICVAVCLAWAPVVKDYVGGFVGSFNGFAHLFYGACFVMVVPLLVVFILAFRFPSAIEKDRIFDKKTARLLKIISVIIFSDCSVFLGFVIWLFATGERLLSPAFAFVGAIGFVVAFMLLVLSDYVCRAAILKEEVDSTL